MTEIGKLTFCSAREAWPHEATSFTPWLFEHLEELGNAVGLIMDGEETEYSVGPFFADILARNVDDDSLIIIENQLEKADHKHLGQIITYISGAKANTVIWIAEKFSDEHLSAISWLNSSTIENFSFFAVELKTVRIGDSPIAPLFEVLEKPNNWERRVQRETASSRQRGSHKEFREEFWANYLETYPEDETLGAKITGAPSCWLSLPDGINLIISIYLAQNGVGIFIRGMRGEPDNVAWERLKGIEEILLARLAMTSSDQGNHNFTQSLNANMQDRANWKTAAEFLHSKSQEYRSALIELLDKP